MEDGARGTDKFSEAVMPPLIVSSNILLALTPAGFYNTE